MLKHIQSKKKLNVVLMTAFFFMIIYQLSFAAMTSDNYGIPTDSIGIGGGNSESSSYILDDHIGETATGESSSDNYNLDAGFLASYSNFYISISVADDVNMSPSISGISGGSGDGSMSWTVVTDNPNGYAVSVRATTNPALRSASSNFADYTPAGGNPDYLWQVDATASEFGFSPEGAHVIQKYLDDGSACNTGALNTADRCWDYLDTVGKLVAESPDANHPTGTVTSVKVKAEVGATVIQPPGDYAATVEVTAIPL
jgi:hypothetical protein